MVLGTPKTRTTELEISARKQASAHDPMGFDGNIKETNTHCTFEQQCPHIPQVNEGRGKKPLFSIHGIARMQKNSAAKAAQMIEIVPFSN